MHPDDVQWHGTIQRHLLHSAEVKRLAVEACSADIAKAVVLLVDCL